MFLFFLFKRAKISNDLKTLCDILEEEKIEQKSIFMFSQILFKNYLLDIFTAQRDRNVNNQGFLYNGNYELAPRYDSANSFLTLITNEHMVYGH